MDVIILAGGLGTRLRSVVSKVPKCMAPVVGKPFLSYLFQYLSHYDVSKVILSVGYLREKIYEWVDMHRDEYSFTIEYVEELEPLGTGGGIKLALQKATSDEVCILNGDTYFDVELSSMLKAHIESGKELTLALKPLEKFDRYGNVEIYGSTIAAFREKTYCEKGLINGGVYIINRNNHLMDGLPDKFSFEKSVLEPAASNNSLNGCVQNGYFIDIGIPEDYCKANSEFANIFRRIDEIDVDAFDTILMDRDGTINVHRLNDYVKNWDEFVFLPNVVETIAKWHKAGKRIIVVTNQRGVGKGAMTEAELQQIHQKMKEAIAGIESVYYCTALTSEDINRKPNIGMFNQILSDYPGITKDHTIMIGDSDGDMEFAKNCGIKGVRV